MTEHKQLTNEDFEIYVTMRDARNERIRDLTLSLRQALMLKMSDQADALAPKPVAAMFGKLNLAEYHLRAAVENYCFQLMAPCNDCGVHTAPRKRGHPQKGSWEWYHVWDHVWAAAGMGKTGFLCVGCLERRLERQLEPGDFSPGWGNAPHALDTPRLSARKRRLNARS